MFQSILGHSSEQSIANHSSRPTVLPLKCVSSTISNWFGSRQPQKTKISTVTDAPFIQNSSQRASRLTATTSFLREFFQPLQYSRQRPSFPVHRAALMTKIDLTLPTFSLRFQGRFRSSILLSLYKFSFHQEWRSSQVWQWRDFPGPITILRYA